MAPPEPLEARRHRTQVDREQPVRGSGGVGARMAATERDASFRRRAARRVERGASDAGGGEEEGPHVFVQVAAASAGRDKGVDERGFEERDRVAGEGHRLTVIVAKDG